MRVIGVDPGKTTGICSFIVIDDEPHCINSYELDLLGAGRYFEEIAHLEDLERITFVCEAFIITPQTAKNSQAPWSLEVIGILKYFCQKYRMPLFFHAPSSHKRLVTNPVLTRMGLYVQGEHARDGARIAAYHVITDQRLLQRFLKEDDDAAG